MTDIELQPHQRQEDAQQQLPTLTQALVEPQITRSEDEQTEIDMEMNHNHKQEDDRQQFPTLTQALVHTRHQLPATTQSLVLASKLKIGELKTETILNIETSEKRWTNLLKLWGITDRLVTELIDHARGSPQDHQDYIKSGKQDEEIKKEYETLPNTRHKCGKKECEEEDQKLLEITWKNMEKTVLKESSREKERTDRGYLEWKEWLERDALERKEKQKRL